MSGGFFRGTSADQDTRFSNKNAKLLKTQKFAPELDQLVDIGKINMNVMRPWIANRVTELMGFEDEVLINFIYGLLEAKNVDGKQIQINLTGFMEKNTGKFMRELWGLLTSAQNSMNGIPQQFLDQKAEEVGKKKAEEQRVLAEVQRKEEEKKGADQDLMKKENLSKAGEISIPIGTKLSSFKGEKSPDGDGLEARNGTTESRPPRSRSRSASLSNKNVSRYPRKRNLSQSISRSPPRRSRRSMTPRRRMSPSYRRSRSPVRRARSPIRTRSPRRHRRSSAYSRSPRGRSPIAVARSPRRRRSPSYSPRGRSPILHSPRRRHSPVHSRSSPRRRKSPHRTPPRYRRRSPVHSRSPPRRYPLASPPARRRHTAASPKRRMDPSPSPRRRPVPQSARRASRSPLHSLSPEASSKSPRGSPHRHISTSPLRSFSPSPRGRSTRASLSLPSYQHSPSPSKVEKTLGNRSRGMLHSAAPEIHKSPSPSLSPERWQRSRGSLDVSPVNMKSHLKSPLLNRGLSRDRPASPVKSERSRRIAPNVPTSKKRTRSFSRENPLQNEDRQAAPVKKPTNFDAISDALPAMNHQARKHEEPDCSISKSSDGDQQMSPRVDQRNRKGIDSDENEENHSNPSPIHLDDRKEAKRRRKEERRLRKEEKRRRREERHRRKEEKRASKASSKDIASVTPPPDLEKRMMCTDDNNTSQEGKHEEDEDMEIEQRRLENELRKKALESIKAKKVGSS